MTYRKLTQTTVDMIVSELKVRVQHYRKFCSNGNRFRVFSVRTICKKAGISHTTFYRWMRVSGSLKQKKCLTDTEKRLRAFGEAVDAVYCELEVINQSLSKSALPRNPSKSPNKVRVDKQPRPQTQISEMETQTDALTGSTRWTEFAPLKSLNNM